MKAFTTREMSTAMDRYYEVAGRESKLNADFWEWLAMDWDKSIQASKDDKTRVHSFYVPDESGIKVDLLLSPHYRALMKAYQIKHGKDHGSRNRSRMG